MRVAYWFSTAAIVGALFVACGNPAGVPGAPTQPSQSGSNGLAAAATASVSTSAVS